MSVASFQALCDEFCDAAGVGRDQMREDSEGAMTFSAEISEVAVNVVHMHATHPTSAFLLVDFGPPPEKAEAEALRALLLINFTFLGHETATAFSIHPVYGNVTLQATYRLENSSGAKLLRSVQVLAAAALQWRQTHYLQGASDSGKTQLTDFSKALRA